MIITETEAKNIIKNITKGRFFGMSYKKKDGTDRHAICQLGVKNPINADITPKGTGVSAKDALEKGRILYYEPNHRNEDGTTSPAYRSACISRLQKIVYNGITYKVIH